MKDAVSLFIKKMGIEEDCAMGAVERATALGISTIVSVKNTRAKRGFVAEVTDAQRRRYKFGFGGLGYLEYIYSVDNENYLYSALE